MPRLSYIDGRVVRHDRAMTHIEDRGYQFADSVYEVVPIIGGRLIDLRGHIDRLWRSLSELDIDFAMSKECLVLRMFDLIYGNEVREGNIYLQISRGVGARLHSYIEGEWRAVLVMVTNQLLHGLGNDLPPMQSVITVDDIRWGRCDIKTTGLLANCLASTEAHKRGCYEAWQVDAKGYITEGTHSNSWIVTSDRKVLTRQADSGILNGITRTSLLSLIESHGFSVEQRSFSRDEAYGASEAFLTSSGGFVKTVGRIDDKEINGGKIGEVSRLLYGYYRDYCLSDAHPSAFLPLGEQGGIAGIVGVK